jgi:hypothetical protein
MRSASGLFDLLTRVRFAALGERPLVNEKSRRGKSLWFAGHANRRATRERFSSPAHGGAVMARTSGAP